MKAKLVPLEGKYYGTEIQYIGLDGDIYTIKLWNCHDYKPSKRELAKYKMTLEQYKADGMTCDSHFESAFTYDLAQYLVDCLNKYQYRGMTS